LVAGHLTARAHAEWRARVRAEYVSAAITAQTVHWMIVCGLPDDLLRVGLRVVADELDHARLSHDVVRAIGGGDLPEPISLEGLVAPTSHRGLGASLIDAVLGSFCIGETLAVPLFSAMRARTTQPQARAALDRILRDEAVHRAFGWDALDALLALDEPGLRERADEVLPAMIRARQARWTELTAHPPLTDDERDAGLLSAAEFSAIADRALLDDALPRFARRQIATG
jgi:hypothetical protein